MMPTEEIPVRMGGKMVSKAALRSKRMRRECRWKVNCSQEIFGNSNDGLCREQKSARKSS